MKYKWSILLLLQFLLLQAQNGSSGLVNYEETFGATEKNQYELSFCNNESFYEQFFPSRAGQSIQTIGGFIEPQIPSNYYLNVKTHQLIFKEGIAFKAIVAQEDQITIDWKILNETKKIGNFICQKATAAFKGNNYIAWFSTDIPVPFGPWKLHGLPGLILECNDETNFFQVKATKIHLNTDCKELTEKMKKANLKNPVSMKKYLELRNNENEDIFNFYQSISPRDTYLRVETDYTGFSREPLQ